jgi:uncharacterized membrane protein YfcA
MKLPFKISSATSSFMIGVTASASAGAYFFRGDIRPELAGPVALGILVGSLIGPKLISKFPTSILKKLFMLILFIAGIQMFMRGLRL